MPRFLITLISIFLFSSCIFAQDDILRRWDFDSGGGWRAAHNVKSLRTGDGVLRLTTSGYDAYFQVGGLNLPIQRAPLLRVRMRSDKAGETQVYFSTDVSPDPAGHSFQKFKVEGDNKWRTYEVDMRDVKGWSGNLTMLRLDPVNPAVGAKVEIDFVQLYTPEPKLQLQSLAAHNTGGDWYDIRLSVGNIGGPFKTPPVAWLVVGEGKSAMFIESERVLKELVHAATSVVAWTLNWTVDSSTSCRVLVHDVQKRTLLNATCRLYSNTRENKTAPDLSTDIFNLHFMRDVQGVYGMRIHAKGSVLPLAVLEPLATLAYKQDGAIAYDSDIRFNVEAKSHNQLKLVAQHARGRIDLRFNLEQDRLQCDAIFRASRSCELLRFGSMAVRVPGISRGALFPGVEYLDAGERSSDDSATGPDFAPRTVPPPYWITVPVMAAQTDRGLVALLWDPMQKWGGSNTMPAALFASPNFIDGQDNQLLNLFAPAVGEWTQPNCIIAGHPYAMNEGDTIALKSVMLLRPGARDVVEAVDAWYNIYGTPPPVALPRTLEESLELCMKGYRDTLYEAGPRQWHLRLAQLALEAKASFVMSKHHGWTHHWGLGEKPAYKSNVVSKLIAYASKTGRDEWLPPQPYLSRFNREQSNTRNIMPPHPRQMSTQREGGTWGYTIDARMRAKTLEVSGGYSDTLGKPGSTNVGICAVNALPVLRHALQWKDPVVVAAAKRALKAMRRFHIPAGAQTWEVHKDAPDVVAAARAADCFRLGYELTGDKKYLDEAVRWLRTGLPFHYSWPVPLSSAEPTVFFNGFREYQFPLRTLPASEFYQNSKRTINPYASIPVFGVTFYRVPWYGNVVQWCGLAWVKSVFELRPYYRDELLDGVARGVLYSALPQQFDKAPFAGLYPDSWHLDNNAAYPAHIGPFLIEECLQLELRDRAKEN
jgi:hypothetical protein